MNARLKKALKILLFLFIIDGVLLGASEATAHFVAPPYHSEVVKQEGLAAPKPVGQKRVFIFGESTIYGFPYGTENSTACWVKLLLAETAPKLDVQVVNLGRPARGSFHLEDAVAATLRHRPDAVVLCLGHNEFLPRSIALAQSPMRRWLYFRLNLFRSSADALDAWRSRQQADVPSDFAGIPPWSAERAQIVAAYLANVESMVESCRQANVSVVLCAPACNLVCPPRLSAHRQPLSAADQARHAEMLDVIRAKSRRDEAVSVAIAEAVALSPDCAEIRYWQGRELLRKGKTDEARQAFESARDLDCLPFRCTGPMLEGLRRLAADKNVRFVDLPAAFLRENKGQPPGMNWFIDACHPRPWGQFTLAREMTAALRPLLGESLAKLPAPSFAELAPKLGLTAAQWREPERARTAKLLKESPELVVDLAERPPALAAPNDAEWAALRREALIRCGRRAEAP